MHMPDTRGANVAILPIFAFSDGPAPMRYPDPEELERARRRRAERIQREQLVIETQRLIHAHEMVTQRTLARDAGFRAGHVNGTHWGVTVGMIVGAAYAVVILRVAPVVAERLATWWPL